MKTFKTFAAAAAVALAATVFLATPASAGTIFDSRALGEPLCGFCESETRSSDYNYAAMLSFSADVSVDEIGIWSSVDDAQDVKFLIFESFFGGGSGNLLFSQTKSFAAQGQGWLYTDAMNFTFQSGKSYDVGILGNGFNLTGRYIAFQDLSSGPVTEISQNANFHNYLTPTTGCCAGVSPWVQLNNGGVVPEPSTWAMMIIGFGAAGSMIRRRRAVIA